MKTLQTAALITLSLALSSQLIAQEKGKVEFLNPASSKLSLPFSEAVKVGDTLFLSGQIGLAPGSKKVVDGGISMETKQTLVNIENVLKRNDYSMKDVVKCTAILADISEFGAFNTVYKEHFSAPFPARTTFAASGLALNAKIEIECIAAK